MSRLASPVSEFINSTWETICAKVDRAVVFVDRSSAECLHWSGGVVRLLDAGAINIKELSSFESGGKLQEKAVFIVGRLLREVTAQVISDIVQSSSFKCCIVITLASAQWHEKYGVQTQETSFYDKFEENLLEWMGNMNYTAEVIYCPVFCASITPQLFVTPPFSEFFPLLPEDVSTMQSSEGMPSGKKPNLKEFDITHLHHNLQAKIQLFVECFDKLFEDLAIRDDCYSIGSTSSLIATELAATPSARNRKKIAQKRASILFVDRTLDLAGCAGHHGDTMLDRILQMLPRLPGHDNDVMVDMLPMLYTDKVVKHCRLVPGSLAHPNSPVTTAMMSNLVGCKQKEALMDLNRQLVDVLQREKLPLQLKMGRISADLLQGHLCKFRGNQLAIQRHSGLLQVALGAVQALTEPKSSKMEELLSIEKLLMQNMADSEGIQPLKQMSRLITDRKARKLSMEDIVVLLVFLYSLSDEGCLANTEDEKELIPLLSDAVSEDYDSLPTYLQEFVGGTRGGISVLAAMQGLFHKLDSLQSARKGLKQYRSIYNSGDGMQPATYRPLIKQVLLDIFSSDKPELVDVECKSTGIRDLIKTGFSLFMNVSKPRPTDAPLLIVFIVGGVAPCEVKLIKDIVDSCKSGIQVHLFNQLTPLLIPDVPMAIYHEYNQESINRSKTDSKDGLGGCILQEDHPIAYASRALTTTQKNGYSQLEKELLAIVFGCKRFHDYVYGKTVLVETDHKPLVSIFQKNLCQLTPRVQKMILHLQRYDLKVTYKPGKELLIADTLSRAYLNEHDDSLYDELLDVNTISSLPMSQAKLEQFQTATRQSASLQALRDIVLNGWPESKNECPASVKPYWSFRDEIAYHDQLLFKSDRVIVPETLRAETLKKIHESHQGIVRSKQRARDVLFWPGMSQQIQETVEKCTVCAKYKTDNAKEPLMPHTVPDRPWSKVGVDLFTCNGDDYIVVVDYYSKFSEVMQLRDQTSTTVINKLKSVFARHGIPDTLMSDNGPQLTSSEFLKFAATWDFRHITSSPRFPQSNGQAENAVKTMKTMIKKCREEGNDPYLALLDLRNTPVDNIGKSPAQLLMSRRLRATLPTSHKLLYPHAEDTSDVVAKHIARQHVQKDYFDRHAGKSLFTSQPGDRVRVQVNEHTWQPATVKDRSDKPRSYVVETTTGRKYRRNRINIRPSKEAEKQFEPKNRAAYVRYEPNRDEPIVPDIVEQPPSDEPPPEAGETVTRSGRVVHKPLRYRT
ncbi:PREDICTED: sec1 family domain-containing protein 2-like [Priapulus caudatus]|uniref:RNA-directed DNA polymerase n=1 Tax=Priapulus caudatus TaxID=37621 RepID=A0ABM1EWH1_PRICU|nr:PREDICTED: sec1 family domain-containing protein 2-like [Priapulus caudatus]